MVFQGKSEQSEDKFYPQKIRNGFLPHFAALLVPHDVFP